MKYGYCKATAQNQYFLDTCPAVTAWFEDPAFPAVFAFSYKQAIDVPYAPGIVFAGEPSRLHAFISSCSLER
jgi:hypothetical protein